MKIFKIYTLCGFLLLSVMSCKKLLDEPVYSQLVPDNFLTTEDGIKSVLRAAYVREARVQGQTAAKGTILSQEAVTDIMFQTAGADNRQMLQFLNFTWDANLDWLFTMLWSPSYLAIRDANSVMDNIDKANISEALKTQYKAEARFVRAISYYSLYNFFGPVPIRTTTVNASENMVRASDAEMRTFIETELKEVLSDLPDPGSEEYGRANKGAVRAYLCKFYLNTKQWQKSADMAKEIIDMGKYMLNGNYSAMFRIENERNKEYIWVRPAYPAAVGNGPSNDWEAYVFPVGFQKDPISGLVYLSNWRNYAAQYSLRDAFYNTFETKDKRKETVLTSYINTQGQTVSLLNNTNNTRPLKFWPDPAAIDGGGGNDIPVIRYADILLSRAEALNELNGSNTETISLINQIRVRAGLDEVKQADFADKDELRDQIIKERGWEFYCEGLRREDLIRTGKFIPGALARGVTNAKPHHVLYPIPQQAMDSDSKLVQNTGY
nr:RagB/SusD family nutrient uptake outer membrane protein [Pedobacter panaciterrae]